MGKQERHPSDGGDGPSQGEDRPEEKFGREGGPGSRDDDSFPPEALPHVPMREFLERTPARLLAEAAVGAAGGGALSLAFPMAPLGPGGFALAGALAAPLALLLTPVSGSLTYRAFRYGLGLALPVTLAVSFIAGADGFLVEELLILGVLLFCIGAVGHGLVASALDGATSGSSPEGPSP
jgi:hypothetical protein